MKTASPVNPASFMFRMKYWREQATMSQAELARKTGLDPTAISHLESGRREPSLETFRKVVLALNVSADNLLGISRLDHNAMRDHFILKSIKHQIESWETDDPYD